MIWWTGLAPWEFELPFPGSVMSTFLPFLRLRLKRSFWGAVMSAAEVAQYSAALLSAVFQLTPHGENFGAPPLPLQGYLAHKEQSPPLGPPYDPRYSLTVGS